MTEHPETPQTIPSSVESREGISGGFMLQTPGQFVADFASSAAVATRQVAVRTMQFENCEATRPIFNALTDAKERGVPTVDFLYDRVALRHLHIGKSQSFALGRIAVHLGDKPALKQAFHERQVLVGLLESAGITDPDNRKRVQDRRMSHDHVKLAIIDDTAWFGTMNLRASDFEMSNFMMRVTDPACVAVFKEVYDRNRANGIKGDIAFNLRGNEGAVDTVVYLDEGEKGQSIIYDRSVEMAQSLEPGDSFILIGQWPPVPIMYGDIAKILHQKTTNGVHGTYLISPEEDLHPSRRASRMLQKRVKKMEALEANNMEAINLPRKTHAKAFLILRKNGDREVLFGSHNLTRFTVRNGTRELAMWTEDVAIVDQVQRFLEDVRAE